MLPALQSDTILYTVQKEPYIRSITCTAAIESITKTTDHIIVSIEMMPDPVTPPHVPILSNKVNLTTSTSKTMMTDDISVHSKIDSLKVPQDSESNSNSDLEYESDEIIDITIPKPLEMVLIIGLTNNC